MTQHNASWAETRFEPACEGFGALPGELGIPDVARQRRTRWSTKGLVAATLLVGGLVAVAGFTIHHYATGKKKDDADSKLMKDKPMSASTEPRRLDMPSAVPMVVGASGATPRVPALVATADERADPIGVRRTGTGTSGNAKTPSPEDAPVMLVSTRPGPAQPRTSGTPGNAADTVADPSAPADPVAQTTRNLQAYQRQLQGVMENLTRTATSTTAQATGQMPTGAITAGSTTSATNGPTAGGLFGGQLSGSSTPKVSASMLGNRSLTLPKGTAFTCALKTKVISAVSGLVGCQVQRNVFSDDGRVLLIERGSHIDGEYRVASVRPGTVRIPVLWTRIRTPFGVTVDIDSPGTGPLGESGIDGYVDNRWGERIGAAMLLSVIDDAVKLIIQGDSTEGTGNTVILPSTTSSTSKLAEKVLDSTINIPPLIYQNHGGIVGIYVARDVDFASVYELRPTAMETGSDLRTDKSGAEARP